jgi:hypothetical protein
MLTWIIITALLCKLDDKCDDWKYRRSVFNAKIKEEWEKKKATQTPRSAKREKIGLIIFWAIITPPILYLAYRIILWLPV